MRHVKPNEREVSIANERFGEVEGNSSDLIWERRVCADALAAYRMELTEQFDQERMKLELRARSYEKKMLEVFKAPTPEHFGLEDNEWGRGYMAAIDAVADEAGSAFKDVALRITDRRLRDDDVAFISLRISRTGEPTCRVLRIQEDGTSSAGEGRSLDLAMTDLKRGPGKPDVE